MVHADPLHDEGVDGDLIDFFSTPQPLGPLSPNLNTVTGGINLNTGDQRDVFSFVVPAGVTIGSIEIDVSNVVGPARFILDVPGGGPPPFIEDLGTSVATTLTMTNAAGLGPGTYLGDVSFGPGSVSTDRFDYVWRITAVPEPSMLLPLCLAAGFVAFRRRRAS